MTISFRLSYFLILTLAYIVQVGRNICHGSDAVESAQKEIALWFKPEELVNWDAVQNPWVYE